MQDIWYDCLHFSSQALKIFSKKLFDFKINEKIVCLGTADGKILVFIVPSKGPSVKLQETLEVHQGSICDIAADGQNMASSDETGKIILWKAGGHFTKTFEIDGFGYVLMRLYTCSVMLL